jgi:hypothetical protein
MSRISTDLMVRVGLALLLTTLTQIRGQTSSKSEASPHLSLIGFSLEKNTLTDVQEKLGISTAGACSDEAGASKMICYVSEGPEKTKILFEAGFSGGWSRLDGFKVVSGSLAQACHLQCKATTAFRDDIQTSGGLKLGLTRGELIALLGPPSKATGTRLTFEWWSKRPMTKAEIDKQAQTFKAPVTSPYWDVHDIIEVTLSNSKVAEFEVHHTVTY